MLSDDNTSSGATGDTDGQGGVAQSGGTRADLSKILFFDEKLSHLFKRLKGTLGENHPTLVLLMKEVELLENYFGTKNHEHLNADGIKHEYEKCCDEFLNVFGAAANRGQKLSGKSHHLQMCFATFPCRNYIDVDGRLINKMDPKNCCITWLKKFMFYSIWLQDGMSPDILTTNVAEDTVDEYMSFSDAMLLTCRSTVDNPEGNKWGVMKDYAEGESEKLDLEGGDLLHELYGHERGDR